MLFTVGNNVGSISQKLEQTRGLRTRNEVRRNMVNFLGSKRGSWEGELPACNVDPEGRTDLRRCLGRRDKRGTLCEANCWPLKKRRWPEIEEWKIFWIHETTNGEAGQARKASFLIECRKVILYDWLTMYFEFAMIFHNLYLRNICQTWELRNTNYLCMQDYLEIPLNSRT